METIDKIVNLMNHEGISAYQLEKETGVSNSLISQWKAHRQNPSVKNLKKIARYFNVPWETLSADENDLNDEVLLDKAIENWDDKTKIDNINFIKEYFNESEFKYILKMRCLNYKGVQRVLAYIDDLYGNPEYRADKK